MFSHHIAVKRTNGINGYSFKGAISNEEIALVLLEVEI